MAWFDNAFADLPAVSEKFGMIFQLETQPKNLLTQLEILQRP